ncbi:hypothetical protein [Dinghuibacter silviterrae]|uniref:hypothetical protein n=1 Tax=Dinghuibacter silviterrae TaxID=1539049 RepID=UPI001FE5D17F|nr:hypothetical protein [Dinghuibacter silviterrae]
MSVLFIPGQFKDRIHAQFTQRFIFLPEDVIFDPEYFNFIMESLGAIIGWSYWGCTALIPVLLFP